MSEIKLLPCPFCGGEARLESTGQYAVVGCKNDNCQGYACCYKYDSKKEAIEHWNTRKPMERIIERICNVRNNTPSTDFKNGCNASLHQIHREIDIKVKEEGGIE